MDYIYCKSCGAALEDTVLVWYDHTFCDTDCAVNYGVKNASTIIDELVDNDSHEMYVDEYMEEQ